jgi:hypothetical protein
VRAGGDEECFLARRKGNSDFRGALGMCEDVWIVSVVVVLMLMMMVV